jgi:alpha/beta hydrolase family protein
MRRFTALGRFAAKLARLGLVLLIAVFILLGILYLSFGRLLQAAQESLRSHPAPMADYAAALRRFQQIQETEGPELNPVCRSILLTHGQRTERALVFFHGYTNCPQQFRDLGHIFYELGYNVLIPRLPRHGLADRKVENLSPLKAEELRECADTSVDIACGIGRKVYVAGLSAGGTVGLDCPKPERGHPRGIDRTGVGLYQARGYTFAKGDGVIASDASGHTHRLV